MKRRRDFLALSGASLLLGGLAAPPAALASTLLAQATRDYQPQRGQSGKDVIWIPTPDKLVTRMLSLAQLGPSDFVIDLGAGDGKIVIAAAREFGARGLGIEYNPDMVEHARRNAQAAGVAERARFEKADIFESDFSPATVVTMYLLPHLNMRLRHRLMALKPGTRVVSHEFRLGNWTPDETSRIGSASVHLWLVPGNFGGDWQLRFMQRKGPAVATLAVEQTFQNFRGRVVFEDFETSFREPKVHGDRVSFAFTDEEGRLRRFEGRFDGDSSVTGTAYDGDASSTFVATRIGRAPAIAGSAPVLDTEIFEN
ncbi:class I SAM-dependent methyltransferase [Burkholderiaceae bacterium FT117]|uniref:class I SAM-dependent methyltransferase n=1 Tax=Zeimonas sediminis TaxID=2944268 RepID=UPI00234302F7|nr:class I SAM-dependent methyltransferase [Zeimonas sediminis]MCM5571300.1 class I SAM-dependent methyltransferase [Zeimonas sediminis]